MRRMTSPAERLASARVFLFVPGDRPERFAKATLSGADVIIIDLEDAVPAAHKPQARHEAVSWLDSGGAAVVRVNAPGTEWFEEDVATIAPVADGLMIPKAECAEDWKRAGDVPVIPLIETAGGIERALKILSARTVVRPAFGSIDLAAQLGIDPNDRQALLFARSRLCLAAAAARRSAPIDGVTTAVRDAAVLRGDVEQAASLGMTAKLCIHPAQVPLTRELFKPSPAQVEWARSVVAAVGDGVGLVDGHMVDAPVLARARGLLTQALEPPNP